jgi:ankyrin repeat protein
MPPPTTPPGRRAVPKPIAPALVASVLLGLAGCGADPTSVEQSAQFQPSTILDAVLVGDQSAVEQFVARGADVNSAEADGTSLLMRAIHGRFPEIAKTLIDAGANVSAANRYGVNPLYLAARGSDAASTRELLAAGADANTSLPEGETVLMTAAKAGSADIVRMLLAGRSGIAPPAFRDSTGAPTSGYGAAAVIGAGPENRADPNAKEGWYGQTALMWAAAEGNADIVQLLIAAGAKVAEHSRLIDAPESSYERLEGDFVYPKSPQGRLTALHFAARAGALDVVPALIEGGADLDAVDAGGTSPLLLAALNGRFDVARVLLDAGANPNIADDYGRTVLFAAADLDMRAVQLRPTAAPAGERAALDVVALALAKGADPNVPLTDRPPSDDDGPEIDPLLHKGATPLFRAALSGGVEIMSLLLEAGADPLAATDARDPVVIGGVERPANGGTTPLMAAAGVGWRESTGRGSEADAIAALQLLLDRGADVNAANQMGDTALHGATLRGSTAIIQFLVDHGADVNARNGRGKTALDIAVGLPSERVPYNEAAATLLRRLTPTG